MTICPPSVRSTPVPIGGVILAGGLARRMGGGDKALVPLQGRPLLAHVVEAIAPQISGPLLLNANGDPSRLAAFGLPVVADSVKGFPGPLAGILAGMEWLRNHAPECRWMLSLAADTPRLPPDLARRLLTAVEQGGAEIACAASLGRVHPVLGVWPVALADALRHALVVEDERRMGAWIARHQTITVEWPGEEDDPFFNVNTPEDLHQLESRMRSIDSASVSHRFGIILNQGGGGTEDLLAEVVKTLLAEGHALGGLYQKTTPLDNGRSRMEVVDITTGCRHLISQDLGSESSACCLDPGALVETSAILRRAMALPVALLVVSKFAGLEVEGQGLAPDAFEALTQGLPVLTCLSQRYQEKFEALSGGLGTYLPPDREAVLAWARHIITERKREEHSA